MKKYNRKYIITYGSRYMEEIYSFDTNISEAKLHITGCIEETGCGIDEVHCFEIKSKDISATLKIKLS